MATYALFQLTSIERYVGFVKELLLKMGWVLSSAHLYEWYQQKHFFKTISNLLGGDDEKEFSGGSLMMARRELLGSLGAFLFLSAIN